MTAVEAGLDFQIPEDLTAHEPPEAHGLRRDEVRLMVSCVSTNAIAHTRFSHFPDFLAPGDVVVVNTSATINAALEAVREASDGSAPNIMLHLSTPLAPKQWVVELRRHSAKGTSPLLDAVPGERLRLPAGATATLVAPYQPESDEAFDGRVRLWIADLTLGDDVVSYAARYGSPIRYSYVPNRWPLWYYQTVFAAEPGSAEMPSAGRAFTHEIIEHLAGKGVRVVPLVLHTGVSSLEANEPPYPERYRVPYATANAVNSARSRRSRVVAVGTTAVRALESVADDEGFVRGGSGWTNLVITPERGLRVVTAILTGLHDAKASHLSMLEALAGRDHVDLAYRAALRNRYLWHEFGDLHLLLKD
ncbi:MAG TPA: S-adenosylmethionine:tRNA ribosyltransferase-isomerase [Gemmatimonadaceae bacterium]|nr:S-adenosylmethionine:tRNA ribosyltransferase-isomerase [Gemmatimonadaceae bacterium]